MWWMVSGGPLVVKSCLLADLKPSSHDCYMRYLREKSIRLSCGCAMWQADVKSNCAEAKAEGGEVQECLVKHRPLLSWDCQEQLFRQEVENAEDLRLSIRLFHACLADKKKVCLLTFQDSHSQSGLV